MPTATGYDLRVGTQGLRVNGPIEIYGGTPIIDGEIVSKAEGEVFSFKVPVALKLVKIFQQPMDR